MTDFIFIFIQQLEDFADGKIQVKFGDALELDQSWIPPSWFDKPDSPSKLQIIGNLPFAIATPLTLNLIKEFTKLKKGLFKDFADVEMIFLFQNEVAQVTFEINYFYLRNLEIHRQTFNPKLWKISNNISSVL